MFIVDPASTFTHDVPVMVPIDGGHREDTLKTTFNYLDMKEVDKFDLKTTDGTDAFLVAVIHRFHDLQDPEGKAVDYTAELRDRLLKRQYVRLGLVRHYLGAITKVKEGN